MTCRHCMNWNIDIHQPGTMDKAGLANCRLQVSRAVFYPRHHDCKAFKSVQPGEAAKRDAWLKGVGL